MIIRASSTCVLTLWTLSRRADDVSVFPFYNSRCHLPGCADALNVQLFGAPRGLFFATATAAPNCDGPHVEDVEIQKDGISAAFAVNPDPTTRTPSKSIRRMTNNFYSRQLFLSLGSVRTRVQLKGDYRHHSRVSATSHCRSSWRRYLPPPPISSMSQSLSTPGGEDAGPNSNFTCAVWSALGTFRMRGGMGGMGEWEKKVRLVCGWMKLGSIRSSKVGP